MNEISEGYLYGEEGQLLLHRELCNNSSCLSERGWAIGRGTGGGSMCPHNHLFVLSDCMKGERGSSRERVYNICLSFFLSLFVFSPFTSFQAESLLVRRKVWRGNERGGGGGGGGEEEEEEGREISNNRKQSDTHTNVTHTHTPRVCVSERETARSRGWTGKEGRESDAEAGRAAPPPSSSSTPLPLFSSPLLLPSSLPLSLSLWSRRVAASHSAWRNHERCHHR